MLDIQIIKITKPITRANNCDKTTTDSTLLIAKNMEITDQKKRQKNKIVDLSKKYFFTG